MHLAHLGVPLSHLIRRFVHWRQLSYRIAEPCPQTRRRERQDPQFNTDIDGVSKQRDRSERGSCKCKIEEDKRKKVQILGLGLELEMGLHYMYVHTNVHVHIYKCVCGLWALARTLESTIEYL